MSAFRFLAEAFPVRSGPGAWVPAMAATGAFFALESALHVRHGVAAAGARDALALFWDGLYAAGFLTYLAPLSLLSLREEAGFIRRAFVGFGIQLVFGGGWLLVGPDWARLEPCLLVSNAVFVAALLSRRLGWVRESSAAAGVASLALATMASNRHDAVDVAVGAAIGWGAFRAAGSAALNVLASEDLGRSVRFHLANLKGVLRGPSASFWDETYAAGHWAFLDSLPQRSRHYAIAGLLRERFPAGAEVIDVGCGLGTLNRTLGEGGSYLGLDVSSEAVDRARSLHKGGKARFLVGDFMDFVPDAPRDAVILNEMLYYLPLERVEEAVLRAARMVRRGGSVVVSMHGNPKVPLVWKAIDSLGGPVRAMEVRDPSTGSSWTVRLYEPQVLIDGAGRRKDVSADDLRREQVVTGLCLAAGLVAAFYSLDSSAAVQSAAGIPAWRPETGWDRSIPFSPAWIWPYLAYFPLCLTPLLLSEVRSDKVVFRKTAAGFLIQFGAAFAVFWALPSQVMLPPLGEPGFNAAAMDLLRRVDPGFNVFPSLHVANAVYVASLFARLRGGWPSAAVWAVSAAVVASTVLVKQHYLADLPAGAALGAAAFALCFGIRRDAASPFGAKRPLTRAAFAAGFCVLTVPSALGLGLPVFTAGLSHLGVCAVLLLARAAGPAAGWSAAMAAVAATLLLSPDEAPSAVAGALAGAAAWRLAFWDQMAFLDDDAPIMRLRHQLDEALNVFVKSDRRRWDRMYARGQWDFLRERALTPLYDAVADSLRNGAPAGARVVDLGCGNGALLPVLRGWHAGYLGVDISSEAVSRLRGGGLLPGEEARAMRAEEFRDFSGFEAAVFNEVLYYLPVSAAVEAVKAAASGLRPPGVVVVVMTENPKTGRIWKALDAWRAPTERRAFRPIANEPLCELRRYGGTPTQAGPTDRLRAT